MLSWDNDLVRMCWRRHFYREYGRVGGIDLSVGVGVVLGQRFGEDVLEETFVTGNMAVGGIWLKCGGVGVVLGQRFGEDVLEETFVTGNMAMLGTLA